MVNIKEAQEWQRLAAMDLSTAEYLQNMNPLPLEIICYHCQQSAEKYLKGYLVFCGMAPPRMHDLDELCKLSLKFSDTFKNIADQCSDLTAYGVGPRYPMELILEEEDMRQALNSAKIIRDFILAVIQEKIAQEQKQDESQ
ncbi:MAG: HEPN domain-containing protein [Actinobacteria bacterium]|nr:HEPN domain-containing protein [Actinomycetota bacterium]MBU4451095.1 HEPN domain-containing protein [Actinomycetota bacterium]MCG2789528.1 HEPN domain-containing protein [Actinomycetes bacterium]MCG2790871.1 HEPN domain-containing protein [Actinomycetes bacterium]